MKKQRVGTLALIWKLIRGRKQASNRAETGKKEIYFGPNPTNLTQERPLWTCSSPRPLKGPPTATNRQAALCHPQHGLWGGRDVDEGESEGRSPCARGRREQFPPKASPPLQPGALALRGNPASELPLFCHTNLAAQPTSTRGLCSNLQSRRQESCPKPTTP